MASASDPNISSKIQHIDGGNTLAVRSGGTLNVESGGALQIGGVDLTANIKALANDAARYVAAGSTLVLTSANNKQTVKLDTLTGSVVTLPAATGSGFRVKFVVMVKATSNSHIAQVANASDFMVGTLAGVSDDPATVKGWIAANSGTVSTNSDTITLNRGTTGSDSLGEWFDIEDIAANTWLVNGMITQTGTEATPFSAAV